MASILDQIERKKSYDEESGLARAAGNAAWADTFASTPPSEKLRANLNLDDMIATATRRKMEQIAQSDPQAGLAYARQQEVLDRTLHNNEMAKENVRLRQRQFEATGATERRKALEAQTEADHTTALNKGMLKIYQSGAARGTPEFQSAAVDLLSQYPQANLKDVAELGKMAGFSADLTPEQYISEAVKLKKLATDSGMENTRISSYKGRPVPIEGAPVISAEQRTADAVERKTKLQAVAPPPRVLTPNDRGFIGRYETPVKALSEASSILERAGVDANAVWDATTATNNLGKAVESKTITQTEADKAAKAIESFKRAVGKDKKDADYQTEFNEVSGKLKALTAPASTAAASAGPAKVASAAPEVGEIRNGWKFKGGNPADKTNWEK